MKRINVPTLISLTMVLVLCVAICLHATTKYFWNDRPQTDISDETLSGGNDDETNNSTGNGFSGNNSTGDGTTGDGATGNGATGDGTTGDGTTGDGTTGDGTTGDGTTGDGTAGDGTTGDGTTGDGTTGDGTTGDGATGDGTTGDGTTGDKPTQDDPAKDDPSDGTGNDGDSDSDGNTPQLPDDPKLPEQHVCEYLFSHSSAATCTQDGKYVYQCSCGKQQVHTVPKLNHQYVHTDTVESTEKKAGYKLYTCTRCAHSYKETLPLRKPAYKLETCSDSLLGKALPHAKYFDVMTQVMDRYAAKLTREESLAMGLISVPYSSRTDFVQQYTEVYRYIAHTLPYTCSTDSGTKTTHFLAWSPEDKYQILEKCYARIYEILDKLDIDKTTTKWDAIYRINNYVCENRIYAYSSEIQNNEMYRYSATYYSVFAEKASCHNYAILFQMLCLGAGIECHYYPSKTMNHAWNRVYFNDGSSFWVDPGWNDVQYMFPNGTVVETSVENGIPAATVKKLREMYLLITTEELLKDHTM